MTKNLADAIFSAEQTGKKVEKFEALSGLPTGDQMLIWECFNPYRVFNVRKYEWPQVFANVDPAYTQFLELLELLATRSLTGNAARAAVTGTLSQYTERTALALARVLNKDLDCGAGRDTFEKVYPNLGIPRFDIMLAAKIEEKAEGKNALTVEILAKKYKLNFPVIAESKYDGNRLIAIVENGAVEYLSRSGKPSDHCAGLFDEELAKMEQHFGHPIVVDGEVLGSSFQETMNAKGSKGDAAKANLRFYVFDLMSLENWKNRNAVAAGSQVERSATLSHVVKHLALEKIIKSKYKVCHSLQELRDFYAEVLAEGQNPDGSLNGLGEGLIIKNPNGFYEWDRSKNWFKWKPVIDLDLKIVGWEYGKGRLAATVGKVYLHGFDENGREIEAKCGSGLNDKTRAWLLENIDTLIANEAIAMIEAQEVCIAQNATIHSARFPIWIRLRDDK